MNLCTTCDTDFASVNAFDKHRIGKHAYLYAEGVAMTPPRYDGRHCLDADEMVDAGIEIDGRGRWRIAADAASIARWREAA